MHCPKCGIEVTGEGSAFCPGCGARLPAPGDAQPASAGPARAGDGREPAGSPGVAPVASAPVPPPSSPRASPSALDLSSGSPSPVRGPAPRPPDTAPRSPVTVLVNASCLFVEGQAGVIECRIRNDGAGEIARAVLEVSCANLGCRGANTVRSLPPGGESRRLITEFDLEAGSGGRRRLDFRLEIEGPGGRSAFRGEEVILVVPPGGNPGSLVFHIEQRIGEGEKGAMGAYVNAPVDLREAVREGRIRTAGELLMQAHRIPPEWRAVELYAEEDLPAGAAGPKTLAARARACTRLRLDVSHAGESRRWLVLAGREVEFGRSRRAFDVCLALFPPTPENRKASFRISGSVDEGTGRRSEPQTVVGLAETGVRISDFSRNGTSVDGVAIGRGNRRILPRISRVNVAGVLDLEMRVIPAGEEFDPAEYAGFAQGGAFGEGVRAGAAALAIRRENNLPAEGYLALFAGACIGSGAGAAVPLPGSGLAFRHLLVLHLGDGFYVENVSGEAGRARKNGFALEPGRIHPLEPGDRIEAGPAVIEAAPYEPLRPGG